MLHVNQTGIGSGRLGLWLVYLFPNWYSREFLVGLCRPVLQILTLFQTKLKCYFSHPFSDLASISIAIFRPGIGRNQSLLLRLELQQKDLLKSISNQLITLSFLFIGILSFLINLELKLQVHSTLVVPLKTIRDSRPKQKNLYQVSDRNGAKIIPFGAAQTYMTYIREYPLFLLYYNTFNY